MVHGRVSHTVREAFGRRQLEVVLDPESLGHGHEPKRPIGEINHEQRQILPAEGLDRVEKRLLQLFAEIGQRIGRSVRHELPSFAGRPAGSRPSIDFARIRELQERGPSWLPGACLRARAVACA